jgi:Putative beta-barrel porin 2
VKYHPKGAGVDHWLRWELGMKSGNVFILTMAALCSALVTTAWGAQPIVDPDAPPVQIQFSATYNSDITASSAAIAKERGLTQADEIYGPAINLNYIHPLGPYSFFLEGQAGYDFHQNNSILDRERVGAQGGADANLGFCDVTTKGTYNRYQSDLQDLIVGVTKNTQEIVTPEISATCNQTGRLVPSFDVQNTWSNNSAPLLTTSDFRSFNLSGNLLYHVQQIGDVSLIGQYTSTDFPNRVFLIGGSTFAEGYGLYSGGLRFERKFGSTINFSVSITNTSLTPDGGVGQKFDGITYMSNLSYEITPRLTAQLNISRQTLPSNRFDVDYSIDQIYAGELDYKFTSRLSGKLGASNSHHRFEGAALDPDLELTHETDWNIYGSLGYDITPRLSLSLTVTQQERQADLAGYSYSGTIVGLVATKAF